MFIYVFILSFLVDRVQSFQERLAEAEMAHPQPGAFHDSPEEMSTAFCLGEHAKTSPEDSFRCTCVPVLLHQVTHKPALLMLQSCHWLLV